MRSEDIAAIRERLAKCPIPMEARADWDGTNHYEIVDVAIDGDFWWFLFSNGEQFNSATEEGKRLGAIFDYAVAYKRDVAALLEELEKGNHEPV